MTRNVIHSILSRFAEDERRRTHDLAMNPLNYTVGLTEDEQTITINRNRKIVGVYRIEVAQGKEAFKRIA